MTLPTTTRLALLKAWELTHAGRPEAAEPWLAQATDPACRGEVAALRARLAVMRGDSAGSLRWSRRALSLLPPTELDLRGDLLLNVGHILSRRKAREAAEAFADAARLGVEAANPRTALFALQYLASVRSAQGRLREAGEVLQQALDLAREAGWSDLPAAGAPHMELARLRCEQNRLAESLAHAERSLLLGERGQESKLLVGGYVARARIHAVQGSEAEARADLRRLERLIGAPAAALFRGQVALLLGDLDEAEGCCSDLQPPGPDHLPQALLRLQVLRRLGRADEGLPLAERLLAALAPTGRRGAALRVRVQVALLQQAAGDHTSSVAGLRAVLAEARPEGWVRTFLDEGPAMGALLADVPESPYARSLSSLFPGGGPDLPEPLSDREQEVLQLLAAGCSNQVIAGRLFITLGTVKTHVHRIYQKLGVGSRTQAVAAGRAQGLIDEESIFR